MAIMWKSRVAPRSLSEAWKRADPKPRKEKTRIRAEDVSSVKARAFLKKPLKKDS